MTTIDSPTLNAPVGAHDEVGLRERKKRETARAIEIAALELASELGLSEVTVDAISQRADVTSRTFFNYYAGKEDAVIGHSKLFGPPVLPPINARGGVSVLDAVFDAVRTQVASLDLGSPEIEEMRRTVIVANPSLLAKGFETVGAVEDDLAAQVERLLDEEGLVPAPERPARARAVVLFIGAVLRLAMHTWGLEAGDRRPVLDHVDEAREQFRHLVDPL
ncbi:TetR/AcrR family transcriptional regulator [Herbiconiux solani]|uniref:TetR/AcrR family transcriptional regulator n=1 Tax=Herbiconiux solani TaxID=661329 RepID=UPI000825E950|nr:helix-turn-helix domain-containing protein [Herbiconiux solani]